MSKPISQLWAFGPFVALALLFVAYYIKKPAFREVVDARLPGVTKVMARLGAAAPDPHETTGPETTGAPTPKTGSIGNVQETPPEVASREARPKSVDLEKLYKDPAAWPKTTTLKRPTEFPAVVKGKVVGTLRAPAGAQANVVGLRDGNVGVEYRGGGAWLKLEETDVIERLQGDVRDYQAASRP